MNSPLCPLSGEISRNPAGCSMRNAIFALLLLLPSFAAADNVTGFEDYSLTVTITANPDGTAHVVEEVQLIVSPNVVDLYKDSLRSTRLTITDWQRTTGSRNLRYHILGANASPMNTRVFPRPLQRFQYVEKSIAVIAVEYDTSGPIFGAAEAGPRKTRYAFAPAVLSFENAPEGQVLPENAVLVMNILPNSKADISKIFPRPTFPTSPDGKLSTAIAYTWNATGGAIPLTPFEFSFITEQSIDAEVSAYFSSMQARTTQLLFSNYGLLLVILALVFLALFFILKRTKTI